MIECLICHKQFSKNIGKHLNYTHNLSLSQYYDLYLKKSDEEGKCKICGKPTEFYKLYYGYKHYCSKECQINGSIEKFGTYNNRKQAIETCKKQFNGKMNNGAWKTRFLKMDNFEKQNNCIRTEKLLRLYGGGWKSLKLPKIYINNQNTAISKEYLPQIIEYSNTYHNSLIQQELVNFIKSFYSNTIIQNDRQIIKPKELDIVLPDLNLAIEFNGTRWHSTELGISKNYHLEKSLLCRNNNIRLVHIYEFENFEEQKQLLKDLILGQDNYPKNDFNKNNLITNIPKPEIIYQDNKYTIYGAGLLIGGNNHE